MRVFCMHPSDRLLIHVPWRLPHRTQWLAMRLAVVRHVSLPNLVLRRPVVPEAVFGAATPDVLAEHLLTLLTDASAAGRQQVQATSSLVGSVVGALLCGHVIVLPRPSLLPTLARASALRAGRRGRVPGARRPAAAAQDVRQL